MGPGPGHTGGAGTDGRSVTGVTCHTFSCHVTIRVIVAFDCVECVVV